MTTATYEYKTVQVVAGTRGGGVRRQQRALNKLAKDGWELVTEAGRHTAMYGTRKTLTFRRARR